MTECVRSIDDGNAMTACDRGHLLGNCCEERRNELRKENANREDAQFFSLEDGENGSLTERLRHGNKVNAPFERANPIDHIEAVGCSQFGRRGS